MNNKDQAGFVTAQLNNNKNEKQESKGTLPGRFPF
jgi:hypothetical protein